MLTEQVETNKEGWLWPKGDAHTWPTVVQELDEIPVLAALCPEKRVCVQAGGNGGLLNGGLRSARQWQAGGSDGIDGASAVQGLALQEPTFVQRGEALLHFAQAVRGAPVAGQA